MGMGDSVESGKEAEYKKLLKGLSQGDRVDVKVHLMCIFLLRDGTAISIRKGESLAGGRCG